LGASEAFPLAFASAPVVTSTSLTFFPLAEAGVCAAVTRIDASNTIRIFFIVTSFDLHSSATGVPPSQPLFTRARSAGWGRSRRRRCAISRMGSPDGLPPGRRLHRRELDGDRVIIEDEAVPACNPARRLRAAAS
jgi:hypothetical protein